MPSPRRSAQSPSAPRPVVSALVAGGVAAVLTACGSGGNGSPAAATGTHTASAHASSSALDSAVARATATSAGPTETLPDGSTTVLPGHRVVAYYGAATTPPPNALPEAGTPDQAAKAVLAKAKPYATAGTPALGAFELIATIIQGAPGPKGDHAADIDLSTIDNYEASAKKNKLLLILDIQPGTGHYLPHVKRLAKYLAEPNVGIALDPEWQFLSGGYQDATGHSPAREINTVSAYLSDFVQSHHLPQKLFVLHQFTSAMITDRDQVKNEPGLATVMHIDGIGDAASGGNASKIADYASLHGGKGQFSGFKLFFHEDADLMRPQAVLALKPRPDLITYQ